MSFIIGTACKKEKEDNNNNDNITYPIGTVTDVEGNTYKTVKINTQTWMAENLKVTKYRNGDSIPKVTEKSKWLIETKGAYCNYNNTNNIDTINTYGRLYNWYVLIDNRNVCPDGWHASTDDDWTTLINDLGGEWTAGGKLKEAGFAHWQNPNTGATDITGFKALPGGYRDNAGNYYNMGAYGNWWTASEYDATNSVIRYLSYNFSDISRNYLNKKSCGFSVRCVKN